MEMIMQGTEATASTPGTKALWTGRVLSTLATLFMLMDSVGKLVQPIEVIETTVGLGYPASAILGIGIAELACTLLYVVPRTSVLGAVMLTAYLGGAVATHVRVGNPLFSHLLFPTYVAAFVWLGLLLRRPALRAVFPLIRDGRTA